MTRLQIVSPCFYPNTEPAGHMITSAVKHGMTPLLYGVGKGFIPHGADAQVLQLKDFLKTIDAEYVLVTDCKDTLFFAGEKEIMEHFRFYNTLLVMSTERGCWPPEDEVLHGMPEAPFRYKHINAGQYLGERHYIIHCLQHLLDNYRFKYGGLDNSQGWWPLAWLRKELGFQLDSFCRIFQTMSSSEVLIEKEGRPFNEETGMFPCSVHFNGSGSNLEAYYDFYRSYYG